MIARLAIAAALALIPAGVAQAADTATLTRGSALKSLTAKRQATFAVRDFSVRGATATVRLRGTLVLRSGKRRLKLTRPELRVGSASRLTARAGKRRLTLATVFAPRKVRDVSATGVRLDRAPATLTRAAARRIQRALALKRPPRGRLGVVSVAIGAPVAPVPPPAVAPTPPAVVSAPPLAPTPTPEPPPTPIDDGGPDPIAVGVCPAATHGYAAGEHVAPLPTAPPTASPILGATVDWGFSASLRDSFKAFDDANPETYVARDDCVEPYRTFLPGAAQSADDTFHFTASDGWYDPVSGSAALNVAGGFRMGYFIGGWTRYPDAVPPCAQRGQYCGLWAAFTDAQITLDGTAGTLSAYADAGGNVPWRYVPWERRALGALDLTGIVPDTSVPGQVTWRDVPVTLTEEGGPLGIEYFSAGEPLDPITITLRT